MSKSKRNCNNTKGKDSYTSKKSNIKGKRSNYERSSKQDVERAEYAANNDCNDPSWYVPTDQNIIDVANFSLNNILGTDYHLDSVYRSNGTSHPGNIIPGVMSLFMVPAVGVSTNMGSAVNLAATDIYNEIRRANSGTKVYDATDCMQLILALANVYSAMSWAQRLYGLANVYSSTNNYLPIDVLSANGVNAGDVLSSMNTFRTRLNNLVLQINTFNVPKGIPLFDRWYGLYSKIYADSNTARAQLYQYVPAGFYVYDDTSTSLNFVPLTTDPVNKRLKVSEILNYLETMVNNLVYSEDARTISADIEKAFGAGGLYNMPMISEAYSVIPDLSDEMRSQIMNAKVLSVDDFSTIKASVAQDSTRSFLVSNYTIPTTYYNCGKEGGWWLNTHNVSLTPAEVMTSSRLIPTFVNEFAETETNTVKATLASCGSEIVVKALITGKLVTNSGIVAAVESICSNMYIGTFKSQASDLDPRRLCLMLSSTSAFDWAPRVNFYDGVGSNPNIVPGPPITQQIQYIGSAFDFDNGVMLSANDIERLHNTALFGEFGIPKLRG